MVTENIIQQYMVQGGKYDRHLAVVYGGTDLLEQFLGYHAKIMGWLLDPKTFQLDVCEAVQWVPEEQKKPFHPSIEKATRSLEDYVRSNRGSLVSI